jgi:hypothetical protein
MADDERSKTISYLRASFIADKNGKAPYHLAHYLANAHSKTPNIEDRTFIVGEQEIACCQFQDRQANGQLLHIAVSTPGEKMSVVPKPKKVPKVELETRAPEEGEDFMDGDIMLLVKENHVLFCSTGAHRKKASEYLHEIFSATKQPEQAQAFVIGKVADVNKVNMIREKGVKEVRMKAGLFTATVAHDDRVKPTTQRKLFRKISDELKGLFAKDKELKEYAEVENLTAELILRFDKRYKGGEIGQRRIESLAKMVVADKDDEGFTIVTSDGETLSADEVSLRKTIKVPKDGKTVDHKAVWRAMVAYLTELEQAGLLDQ